MAQAHVVRGEYAQARALLERAVRAGGPFEVVIRGELEALQGRQDEPRGGPDVDGAGSGGSHLEQTR